MESTSQPPAEAPAGASQDPNINPEEDIMQLARVGDVAGMEKLFESGEYDATYVDDEGITPLHVRHNTLASGPTAHADRID